METNTPSHNRTHQQVMDQRFKNKPLTPSTPATPPPPPKPK